MKKWALVCPGQGAQALGMGRSFYEADAGVRALFERSAAVLGYDLAAVCFNGPEAELTRSQHAQPAIFTVSVAAWTLLKQAGAPDCVISAGLSSGEWAALHLAGVLTFEDALRILDARGRLMQAACERNPGGMLGVIGLERERLTALAAEAGVEVANYNSPEQTVLSGRKEGLARAEALCKAAGAKRAIPLNVAGAFHSSLMQEAADRLVAVMAGVEFKPPRWPVLSNVTARPHGSPEEIRRQMAAQVVSSVRWVECVQYIGAQGIESYAECGPGRVLAGLIKRIDKQAALVNMDEITALDSAVNFLKD